MCSSNPLSLWSSVTAVTGNEHTVCTPSFPSIGDISTLTLFFLADSNQPQLWLLLVKQPSAEII